jgi:hypothetical protein
MVDWIVGLGVFVDGTVGAMCETGKSFKKWRNLCSISFCLRGHECSKKVA